MQACCTLGTSAPSVWGRRKGSWCASRMVHLPGAAPVPTLLWPRTQQLRPGRASIVLRATGSASQNVLAEPTNGSSSPSSVASAAAAKLPAEAQAGVVAAPGGDTLSQQLDELRELLAQQGRLLEQQREQQRETEKLVQQQQETISRLEARLTSIVIEGAAAGEAAAAEPADARARRELQRTPDPMGIMNPSIVDRRVLGSYDARFHSTSWEATPRDVRMLPRRIVLVRHAQSQGNVDEAHYSFVPDPKVSLTSKGWEQALDAGDKLKAIMDADGQPYRLFFYTSPYLRCKQTTEGLLQAFSPDQLLGVQEEVQLREQDFGNFQDAEGKKREKTERLRYGRFFYRFPHGESGADVYDRMTIFEDHLVRDINAGRFGHDSVIVLVTHGLAARIFLQKWFHWSVDEFLAVWNPPNAQPIVMERITSDFESRPGGPTSWIHTKALYRLTDESRQHLVECTEEMCSTSWLPRGIASARAYSSH